MVHWSNLIKVDTDKVEMIEFDKEAIKGIKIIPVSEAFSILEHTLTKSVIALNLTESQLKNNQNTTSTH